MLGGQPVAVGGFHRTGGVFVGKRGEDGSWRMELLVDLRAPAGPLLKVDDNTILIASPKGIVRVRADGTITWLVLSPSYGLDANTIVRDSKGVVYVGMRHAVQQIVPGTGGYSVKWLVPDKCPHFVETDCGECRCVSEPPASRYRVR